MCFSCYYHSNYHDPIAKPNFFKFYDQQPRQCDSFDAVYFFLWPSIFSIYLLPADIGEESLIILRCHEDHTGNLQHCRQTLLLIKFYFNKNMKGIGGNQPAQFKSPFLGILRSFFYRMVEIIVSLLSLSPFHLFVCFPNSLKYCHKYRGK